MSGPGGIPHMLTLFPRAIPVVSDDLLGYPRHLPLPLRHLTLAQPEVPADSVLNLALVRIGTNHRGDAPQEVRFRKMSPLQ